MGIIAYPTFLLSSIISNNLFVHDLCKFSKTIFYKLIVVLSCIMLWQTFRVNEIKELCTTISNLFQFSNIDYTLLITLIFITITLYMFETSWFKHYIFDFKDFKKKEILFEVLYISIMLLSLVFLNINLSSPFHYFRY